ncbi:MAG: response regulator [Lentisphaerae bacterium]|nr:response regulator [Lentisphaerota bacterium]
MGIQVLIVDDEPTIIAMLARILGKDPIFEMDSAQTGYEAIAAAQKKTYNALVCDIVLPDIAGPDVVREMKARQCCPELVVYISGAVSTAPRNMTGNMVFVRKPFNPSQIIQALMRANRS